MANRISTPEFLSAHLETLQPGEEAFQSNVFPGVYPSDVQSHASAKAGNGPIIDWPYRKLVQQLGRRGAIIRRLRVLPPTDRSEYTDEAVQAIRHTTATIASAGEDARVIEFDICKDQLEEKLGNNYFARRYIEGVETGNAQASFWSVRRLAATGSAALRLSYVGILDYKGDQFLGHEPYLQTPSTPIPKEVEQYDAFWRELYFTQAERLKPIPLPETL